MAKDRKTVNVTYHFALVYEDIFPDQYNERKPCSCIVIHVISVCYMFVKFVHFV